VRLSQVIELRGLRVMGTHGALAEEQTKPQPFEIDLDVELDMSAALASDDVEDTVDYGAVVSLAERVVATEHFNLLEALAGRIADAVLADERVTAVTVTVRKLRPPVAADLATAGVRLTRRRG